MNWAISLGLLVLVFAVFGSILYGFWWAARREPGQEARGKTWEDDQITAEDAVDKMAAKGFTVGRLFFVIALGFIVFAAVATYVQRVG